MDRKGLGLRAVQWFLRGIQCACAVITLAIYSYTLATLSNHNMPIKTSARAVEGIAGIAVAYTGAAIFLLLCIAGRTMAALLAMALDFAFVVAFIYVAVVNKTGASACTGNLLHTQFGSGNSTQRASHTGQKGGFTTLPTYGQACKLESAVLGVSIVAIFFFVFSLLMEVALGRHHWRQKRQNIIAPDPNGPMGPGGVSYTPAGPTAPSVRKPARRGFFARLFSRNTPAAPAAENENMLPQHPTPTDMQERRPTQQLHMQGHSPSDSASSADTPGGEVYQHVNDRPAYVDSGAYDALAYSSTYAGRTGDLGESRYEPYASQMQAQAQAQAPYPQPYEQASGTTSNPYMSSGAIQPYSQVRPLAGAPRPDYQYTDGMYDRT